MIQPEDVNRIGSRSEGLFGVQADCWKSMVELDEGNDYVKTRWPFNTSQNVINHGKMLLQTMLVCQDGQPFAGCR